MANVTVTSAANFIPEIWANRALEILRANIVMTKLVMSNGEIASFQQGDILNIPIPGTMVANDKAANATVTLQVPTDGTVAVTLDKHKEASFLVEDIVRAQQNQEVMDKYLQSAVIAVAERVETDLFGLILNAASNIGTLGTGLTGASLRSARNTLNKAKCPMGQRYMVLSPDDETTVLGDSNLATFFANARPEAIARGALGDIYGFETYMSQYTPVGAKVALGGATGGTFTLTYLGQTTSGLAHNANAAAVKSALEALSTIGAGEVEVTAITGGFEVYMKAGLAGSHDAITGDVSSLTGATDPAVTQTNWNPAFNRGAYMLASRALPDPEPGTGVRAATVRDPDSGLVLRVLYSYNPSYLGHQVTVDVLYGVKTIRAAKAVNVKS